MSRTNKLQGKLSTLPCKCCQCSKTLTIPEHCWQWAVQIGKNDKNWINHLIISKIVNRLNKTEVGNFSILNTYKTIWDKHNLFIINHFCYRYKQTQAFG